LKVKISSDSTCDLSPELVSGNNITLTPLTIVRDGGYFRDGIDIFPADIFAHVDAGGALCSTAAVNVGEYKNVFGRLSEEYDEVVHISIGAEFSSCYQSACIASAGFPNVHVIDSRNLSTGQGHIVLEACRMAKTCPDIEKMCGELRELTGRVEASFLLSRLDYMVKGGRCSAVMALGANILQLKPCIEVIDGKMQVVKKYRGPFSKCLRQYVRDRVASRGDIVRARVFITHTPVSDEEFNASLDAVKQYGGFEEIYETTAGCTIACHCGPGTLGVLFIRSKEFDPPKEIKNGA